jgi:hypothetical protein
MEIDPRICSQARYRAMLDLMDLVASATAEKSLNSR